MTKLEAIRKQMRSCGAQLWMTKTTDAHESEYICAHDNLLRWATGFTGENATFAVTQDEAKLWVDGRFYLQAPRQTAGSGIEIVHLGEEGAETVEAWEDRHRGLRAADGECIAALWEDRPPRPAEPVFQLPREYAEEPASEKLAAVRRDMREQWMEEATFTHLDDIGWVLNLRGSDIAYNPVFFSYLTMTLTETVLYVQTRALSTAIRDYLDDLSVEVREYTDYHGNGKNCELIARRKTCKSPAEIAHIRECHLRDGIAVSRFLAWLIRTVRSGASVDEVQAAAHLDALRRQDPKSLGLSFPTISAYGSNGAVVHYEATAAAAKKLEPRGFYLVDSGGQYLDGTTDVTRTIALGPLTEAERLHYTLVLQGWLRVMQAEWEEGSPSTELDILARGPLKQHGLNFRHGTGHGVGFVGNVHEGPARITTAGMQGAPYVFRGGELVSDEPGYYEAGSHGVRIENLLHCVRKENGKLGFENMTWVPLDFSALDRNLLSSGEEEALELYQQQTDERISPYLTKEERELLGLKGV